MNDTEDTLCPNCGRKPLFSCREGFCKGAPSLEQTKATIDDAEIARRVKAHLKDLEALKARGALSRGYGYPQLMLLRLIVRGDD